MSIQEISSTFKRFWGSRDVLLTILIISVGISSFFLGRASIQIPAVPEAKEAFTAGAETSYMREDVPKPTQNAVPPLESGVPEGGYVASKNGTKYHLPWCGSAKSIKEENKISFKTKEEAEAAGYSPAANCKGI